MKSGDPSPEQEGHEDSREKWITIDRMCDAYEAALQDGSAEREPFLAGVPKAWRKQLSSEFDAIDAAYRDAEETREQTIVAPEGDEGSRRLPTTGRLAELTTLDSKSVWLGRFEIRKRLGSGASGTVWCARDARLERWVALKVPHVTRMMSENSSARFQTEARAAAAISHPNVVQVHEVLIEDGLPILIQQWIDGPSLSRYLKRRGPIDFDKAAEWMAQIADAVACAHEQGIVHRDLKPANIMLKKNRPMILDFGLASYPNASSGLTSEGAILGTPAYMSPEQADGAEEANQPATDIYSMGAILYEMLVGSPPFVGKAREVIEAHKSALPVPPRSRRRNIPRDLETIVLRCLAKSASSRYRSTKAFRDDLRRYLKRQPIRARKVSFLENAIAFCRLRPAFATMAVSIPLVIALAAGIAVSQLRHLMLTHRADKLEELHQQSERHRQEWLLQRYMVQLSRASQELSAGHRSRGLGLLNEIPLFMRSWEWQLLNLVSHSPSQILDRNVPGLDDDSAIVALVRPAKRRRLLAATRQGTILSWKLPSERALFQRNGSPPPKFDRPDVLYRSESPIAAIASSPNGRFLAWIDDSGGVDVWDLRENELSQQLAIGRLSHGRTITFSDDSKCILAGGGRQSNPEQPSGPSSWVVAFNMDSHGQFGDSKMWSWTDRPAVRSLAFIGERRFACARGGPAQANGSIGSVEIWNYAAEIPEFERLLCRGQAMNGLDFHSPTGRLAWCDDLGIVYAEDLNRPEIGLGQSGWIQFRASTKKANRVRFSPDGNRLTVMTADGGVSLWRIGVPTPISIIAGDQDDSNDDATSSSSLAGVAADQGGLDVQHVKHLTEFWGHLNTVTDAVFIESVRPTPFRFRGRETVNLKRSPYLLTASEDGDVRNWSHQGNHSIETLDLDEKRIVEAKWISPHQIVVASTTGRNQSTSFFQVSTLPGHGVDVETRRVAGARSLDTRSQSAGDNRTTTPPRYAIFSDSSITIYQSGNPFPVSTFPIAQSSGTAFSAATLSANRYLVAAVKGDRMSEDRPSATELLLYDLDTEAPPRRVSIKTSGPINKLEFSDSATRVVGSSESGTLFSVGLTRHDDGTLAWDASSSTAWEAHRGPVNDFVCFDRSGTLQIASLGDDGTCAIWDIPVGSRRNGSSDTASDQNVTFTVDYPQPLLSHRMLVCSGPAQKVSCSSRGDRIVTAGSDRVIRVWDTQSGLELVSLPPRKNDVVSVELSPDDHFIMIVEAGGKLNLIRLVR